MQVDYFTSFGCFSLVSFFPIIKLITEIGTKNGKTVIGADENSLILRVEKTDQYPDIPFQLQLCSNEFSMVNELELKRANVKDWISAHVF